MLKTRHLNIGNKFSWALFTSGDEETLEHLFFYCPFSTSCRSRLNITGNGGADRFDIFCQVNKSFQESLFFEIFIIATWEIWKEINNLIFKGIRNSRDS
jgi:hypothetical protein